MTAEELTTQILADSEGAPVADVPDGVLDAALYLLAERASEKNIDAVWNYASRLPTAKMARLAWRVIRSSPDKNKVIAKRSFIEIGRSIHNELGERELDTILKNEQTRWEERHR